MPIDNKLLWRYILITYVLNIDPFTVIFLSQIYKIRLHYKILVSTIIDKEKFL